MKQNQSPSPSIRYRALAHPQKPLKRTTHIIQIFNKCLALDPGVLPGFVALEAWVAQTHPPKPGGQSQMRLRRPQTRKVSFHQSSLLTPSPIESMISWTRLMITNLDVSLVSALRSSARYSSSLVNRSNSLSAMLPPFRGSVDPSITLKSTTVLRSHRVKYLYVRLRLIHKSVT